MLTKDSKMVKKKLPTSKVSVKLIKKKTAKMPSKTSTKQKKIVPIKEYAKTLSDLKKQIQNTQIQVVVSANKELIKLYWSIGKTIVEKQLTSGWGSSVIEQLAKDLQNEFPGITGFSRSNIFYMRAFYIAYEIVQQPVGQFQELPIFSIPWGHNVILITKLKSNEERMWYAHNVIEYGWSRDILAMQIDTGFHKRKGKAITNFDRTLAPPQSDLAQQSLKDPYLFDFLTLRNEHLEYDVEQGLIDNVQKLLLEFGKGFSLVGRQYHLGIQDKDFYIDLLFYHIKLRCYVVVELKAREFDPRDTGQLSFYLSVVDEQLCSPDDKPTIGLILCRTKNNFVAEYALRKINAPIGIASYTTEIFKKLPKNFKSSLPTVEELELELEKQEALTEIELKRSKKRAAKDKK